MDSWDGKWPAKWVHMLMQTGYECKRAQERDAKFPFCLRLSPHLMRAGGAETSARCFLPRCPLPEPPDWDYSYRWQVNYTLSPLTTSLRTHVMLIPEVTGVHWWTGSLIGLLSGGRTDQPCEGQINTWERGRAGHRGRVEVFWKGRWGIGG